MRDPWNLDEVDTMSQNIGNHVLAINAEIGLIPHIISRRVRGAGEE
jgi:hypothetical protein